VIRVGALLTVETKNRTYTSVEDRTMVFSALLVGTVADQVAGKATRTPVQVRTQREGTFVKVLPNGGYAVAGDADRVLPDLATTAHELRLGFAAPGYDDAVVVVSVPAGSTLPLQVPPVQLRPLPVRLQGRVVASSLNPAPVDAALVTLAGRDGQDLVGLRRPLDRDHPAGSQVRELATVGPVRTLQAEARQGATVIQLDNVSGLSAGGVLGIDWTRAVEFATVAGPGPAAGQVALQAPLPRTFPPGTQARGFALPSAGATATLAGAARAGDGLLLLQGTAVPALPPTVTAVRIAGPGATGVEYRALGAVSGAGGFYTLDGVGGVVTLDVLTRPAAAGAAGPAVPVAVQYGQVNVVDLQLAP
jgi:hypothetical protein